MIVLSNDYRSNQPGESSVAHGGPANFARAFSTYVVEHGHEWVGLVGRTHEIGTTRITKASSTNGKTFYECFLTKSYDRLYLNLPKKQDPRIYFAEGINCIRTFIRHIRPDILFLNGFSTYAWMLLEAASQEGLPIVVQHAGIARIEFDQYKHLYSRVGRAKMLAMEQDIVAAACTQVFLNEYSRNVFSEVVAPVPAKQSLVIPLPYTNLFAEAVLTASKKKTKGRPITIGCVARWDRIKNHRALLRVAKEAKRLGLPWTFKSVTLIPESLTDIRFKTSYRRTIDVVPPMDRDALIHFYRSVDLLLLPSHFDVSPTVVMDAALLGKQTLIAPGVGWNSEYRAAGLGRWITDFSDPARVVRKIRTLLREPPSKRFHSMIRTKHAPNKVFDAYIRAFTDAQRICA